MLGQGASFEEHFPFYPKPKNGYPGPRGSMERVLCPQQGPPLGGVTVKGSWLLEVNGQNPTLWTSSSGWDLAPLPFKLMGPAWGPPLGLSPPPENPPAPH